MQWSWSWVAFLDVTLPIGIGIGALAGIILSVMVGRQVYFKWDSMSALHVSRNISLTLSYWILLVFLMVNIRRFFGLG